MNILRRLPLSRLLLLCALVVAIGVSITAIALALGTGQKPPAKPLAQAVHDALAAPPVEGLSANIKLTNNLLEGASLAGEHGSGVTSNPLITGASGRLWVAKDGRARLELDNEKGDTNVVWDGTTVTVYDAAENKVYRYTPKQSSSTAGSGEHGETPSVAKVEEGDLEAPRARHRLGSDPGERGGPAGLHRPGRADGKRQPDRWRRAVLRRQHWRAAARRRVQLEELGIRSSNSPRTALSYGPVSDSVFQISPPPGAKVETVELEKPSGGDHPAGGEAPEVTMNGHGITAVQVLKAKSSGGSSTSSLEGLPKVKLANGVSASELRTALGTVLTFERAGARYVVAGALDPSAVEAVAGNL